MGFSPCLASYYYPTTDLSIAVCGLFPSYMGSSAFWCLWLGGSLDQFVINELDFTSDTVLGLPPWL